ncbi:MAG: class I SAM-dependent methyltransferase [Lentisphaerae bacterium]|nr:class I SAM-dependent methyltransferase [Lentisphaerota bacterium]
MAELTPVLGSWVHMQADNSISCCICGCGELTAVGRHYVRCSSCGHETNAGAPESVSITNERLDRAGLSRTTALDRFKRRVLKRCVADSSFLLDVGSGSGRFLSRNRDMFKGAAGIEIDPASVAFSREVLSLLVAGDISELPAEVRISVATFWHSLEHMGIGTADRVLREITVRGAPTLRVVVSVPAADSRLFRLFGEHAAYYDPATHAHQFTAASLDLLMSRHRLARCRCFHSFAYGWFGWLQSMLNSITGRHNRLYMRIKRNANRSERMGAGDVGDILLACLLLPAAALVGLLDRGMRGSGGVLTACYAPAHGESASEESTT